ncbi:MAG: hypothetical protein J6A38_03620 [Clostridia bacterium]|nr:hypothetical protein [Clostridia bacterium]
MQKNDLREQEKGWLLALAQVEDLAEKKTKIYARLLTDVAIAKELETISFRHQKRKKALEQLAFGRTEKDEEGTGK